MAESRSVRVVEAPCIGVPPERAILVLGAGEAVREFERDEVRTFGRSEMRGPWAEGGGFDEEDVVARGVWISERLESREKVFASGACLCIRELLEI